MSHVALHRDLIFHVFYHTKWEHARMIQHVNGLLTLTVRHFREDSVATTAIILVNTSLLENFRPIPTTVTFSSTDASKDIVFQQHREVLSREKLSKSTRCFGLGNSHWADRESPNQWFESLDTPDKNWAVLQRYTLDTNPLWMNLELDFCGQRKKKEPKIGTL